jgi:hypothetical protein
MSWMADETVKYGIVRLLLKGARKLLMNLGRVRK